VRAGTIAAMTARAFDRAAVPAWSLLLAGLLLWPVTRGGYLLGHDMVFTPHQPLDAASIGVGSAPPRAVPQDVLVALAERVVDGAVVGRLGVVLPLLAAGCGVGVLLRRAPLAAALAATTAVMWNPFVTERLALGQWSLLWCYAALPWLLVAVLRGRGRAGWLGRAGALAGASITPTGGLIAAVCAVALVAGARRPRREVVATAALALALQLPWVVPALVSTASATSDPAGVSAFSARAEHPGGTLLSLLGGGGIWDAEVAPDSRGGLLPWLWLVVLAGAAVYGAPRLSALLGRRLVAIMAVIAGLGLLLALLPALPGGAALLRGAVQHLPGAGLLRDTQKWVLPLVVLEALLVGAAVARAVEAVPRAAWRAVVAVAALAVPLIALPDAPATLRPTMTPVHYPRDWAAVSAQARDGDAAVLPWGSYRIFGWTPGRSVLDPAPRLLQVATVVDDRLAVSGTLLGGEDRRAAAVGAAFDTAAVLPERLAAQGIAWVVVEHGTPGRVPSLAALRQVYSGKDVSLYSVPGAIADVRTSTTRMMIVLIADGLAVFVLLAIAGLAIVERVRTRPKARPDGAAPLL
jgi:hypothetical protein